MRRYLDGQSLDDIAIKRIRSFEHEALRMDPAGYWLAFSGGKDSVVLLDLADRAGVKFNAVHNLTTMDPPELVRFVKTFPDVRIDRPEMSMWQLIRKRGMPPRRNARFCCEVLKERGGNGRLILTGIRWGESNQRNKRQMSEACYRDKTKRYLHPIIDWSTADVWEYIRSRGIEYCSLYDEGFKRLGCVLCPMSRDVERQMKRWPKLCAGLERAIKATWKSLDLLWHRYRRKYMMQGGGDRVLGQWIPMLSRQEWMQSPLCKKGAFRSAEDLWLWWLDRDATTRKDDQPVLFEDDPSQEEE